MQRIVSVILVLMMLFLCACSKAQDNTKKESTENMENMNINAPILLFPTDGYTFDTHTDIQNGFIEKVTDEGIDEALVWLEGVKNDTEQSHPEALFFSWENNGSETYIFELSEAEDFSDSYKKEYIGTSCEMYNLKVGTKYYWRVNGAEAQSFTTEDNIFRFLKLDGALNVRDVGGNNIKQGLVYRGSDIITTFPLSEEGKYHFTDVLGIKTEIELRKETSGTASAVGDRVAYKHLPYRPYKEIFLEENKKGIAEIMEFLSDEENYPVYIHCLGGADRTGMIAIYLRALAGESDDIIHLDYELTSLSTYAGGLAEGAQANGFRSRNYDYYTEFLSMLNEYAPGEPLSVQVRAFLKDCGVTDECMDKIVDIIKK